jgi:hypothetical protein
MYFCKLSISVNGNQLDFEGNFQLDEVRGLIKEWFQALPNDGDQARIDALVAQLRQQNDGLAAAVTDANPGGATSAQPQE